MGFSINHIWVLYVSGYNHGWLSLFVGIIWSNYLSKVGILSAKDLSRKVFKVSITLFPFTDSAILAKSVNWKSVSIPSKLILEVEERVNTYSEFQTNAEFIRRAIATLLKQYPKEET